MQSGQSPFLVNILPLQNVITNTSGLDPVTSLSNSVAALQTVVNTSNRTVYTDFLSAYTAGGAITVLSPLVLSNVGISSNGVVIGGSGSSAAGSAISSTQSFVNCGATVDIGVGATTILQIASGGVSCTTMLVGGTCFAQNFVTLSDSGVKSQISTLTDARGFDGIGTYRFRYTGREEDEIGLLAQEVEEIYPECVMERSGVKYIKYNALVALLVGAVRRLEERVRVLERSN